MSPGNMRGESDGHLQVLLEPDGQNLRHGGGSAGERLAGLGSGLRRENSWAGRER